MKLKIEGLNQKLSDEIIKLTHKPLAPDFLDSSIVEIIGGNKEDIEKLADAGIKSKIADPNDVTTLSKLQALKNTSEPEPRVSEADPIALELKHDLLTISEACLAIRGKAETNLITRSTELGIQARQKRIAGQDMKTIMEEMEKAMKEIKLFVE